MIKAKPAANPNDRLKSFADRIDRLEEERVAIVGDVKDVYVEVKQAGYNPKALRKVLAERRKKTDATLEAEIEVYRAALAEPGATYRSAAAKTGASKSKLHRLVPRNQNGTDDGENGEASQDASPATSTAATAAESTPLPNPEREARSGTNSLEAGAPNPVRDGEASADERDASASSSPPDARQVAAAIAKAAGLPVPAEPDLTLPSFLDRRVAA